MALHLPFKSIPERKRKKVIFMINTIFMNLASSDFAGIFTILFVIAIVVAVIIAVFLLIFTIVKVIKFTSSMKKERAAAKEAAGVSSKKAGSDASEDGAAVFALSFKDGRAVVMSKNKNPSRDVVMLMNSLFTRDGSWRIRLADADYDAKNHKILGTVVNCLGEKGAKVLFDISFFDGKAVNAFKLGIKKKGYDAYLRVGKDSKGVGLCSLHQQGII
jgi:hypothetical protein